MVKLPLASSVVNEMKMVIVPTSQSQSEDEVSHVSKALNTAPDTQSASNVSYDENLDFVALCIL